MPVQGITQSPAAFSQALFDQVKRDIAENGHGLDVPRRTESGPGGRPPNEYTPQSANAQFRDFVAHGFPAVQLAPTQFQSDYAGHLLSEQFHLLNPGFAVNLKA